MIKLTSSFFILLAICLNFELTAAENFILANGQTGEKVQQLGSEIDVRVSPCSTFKVCLSLMGFDANLLKDEDNPQWPFLDGYLDDLESWKAPQTPQSWMKTSCVWYSQLLAPKIGLEKIKDYLTRFQYGNQDMSGDFGMNNGMTRAWLSSSLKISPREQVDFLQKLLREELPIANTAMQMTKQLLFVEEFVKGWKLYGKTGMGVIRESEQQTLTLGWFVGWIEKGDQSFVFAYNILDQTVIPSQRIPRVKQLLAENYKFLN